jgi:hypothetical protein
LGFLPDEAEDKASESRLHFALHHLLQALRITPVEMDPLSVIASVAGLLAAAGKVASILSKVKSSIGDASQFLDQLLSQINELESSLSAVSKFLARISSAPRRRISMIQVDQLVATLTEAVLTFSELEALLTPLGAWSEISMLERMQWAWKEDTISRIMLRLDRHKSSLSLMLTIVQWYVYMFF